METMVKRGVVFFGHGRCNDCRKARDRIREITDKTCATLQEVNVSKSPTAAAEWNVTDYPAVVLLDDDSGPLKIEPPVKEFEFSMIEHILDGTLS